MRYQLPAILGVAFLASFSPAQEPLKKADIAKLAKPATALIDTTESTGSAFAVAANGYFITNAHAVERLGSTETAKLVLNAGEKTQVIHKAKVVRMDKALDLALLKIETDEKIPFLELGDDSKVGELEDTIAFGFPFGQLLGKEKNYPTISVTATTVSSLRRDKNSDLERIQLDGALNPGNSGGPVLDLKGKVVGVVVSGIRGSGLAMAIPSSHVKKFLDKPEIALAPFTIDPKDPSKDIEFKASALIFGDKPAPLDVKLIIASGAIERTLDMKKVGENYVVKAAPYERTGKKSQQVEIVYPEGKIAIPLEIVELSIRGKLVPVGEIKIVKFGDKPSITLNDGTVVYTAVPELEQIRATLGGKPYEFSTKGATQLTVIPEPKGLAPVKFTVVVSRDRKEVGRYTFDHRGNAPSGVGDWGTVERIVKGDFSKPAELAAPRTSMFVISTAGDYIGGGKKYKFDENQFRIKAGNGGVNVEMLSQRERPGIPGGNPALNWATGYHLTLSAPRGKNLAVGEYEGAKRAAFAGDAPGMDFSGEGRGSNTLTGKFVIWELEIDNGSVIKLAADFIQYSEGKKESSLAGSIRFNSKFE